jgi:hypothetical protein
MCLLLTPPFQAEPGRSSKVAPIVEHVDLGCTSNPMRVLIRLTAPHAQFHGIGLKTLTLAQALC